MTSVEVEGLGGSAIVSVGTAAPEGVSWEDHQCSGEKTKALCVLAGVLLSLGTIALDRYFDYEAVPGTGLS